MSPSSSRARFPWRALLYGTLILYLVADLYWWGGPVRRRLEERQASTRVSLQRALAERWVATVNGEPVTSAQLDQALAGYLFQRGRKEAELSPSAWVISRRVALQQLIDDTLVRQYAAADGFQAHPASVARRVAEFERQFASPGELEARRQAMGLDAEELRDLLAGQEAQWQWIESRVAEASEISEEEILAWHEARGPSDPGTENPPLVRARHLFLATGREDTPEREELARELRGILAAGEATFAELAAAWSDDPRSKDKGGDLGWFSPEGVPRDFADLAFGLRPGEISPPFRTALGWHIVEVTDERGPRRLDPDELRPEVVAWLGTERRRYAAEVLLNRLKRVAVVQIFPDVLDAPPPPP